MGARNRQFGLFIPVFLACLLASANGRTEENCHKTASIQNEMNLCAKADAKKADAELSAVYAKLMAKASPQGQTRLHAAEEAWLVYRKRQCEFDSFGTSAGSIHPMIVSECYRFYAIQHAEDLRRQLDCDEGNLSCAKQ